MEEESIGYELQAALNREDSSEEVIKVAKCLKQLENLKDPSAAASDELALTTLMSESARSGSSQAKNPEDTRMQTRMMLAQMG